MKASELIKQLEKLIDKDGRNHYTDTKKIPAEDLLLGLKQKKVKIEQMLILKMDV